MRIG
ncbi:hypothetical protein YPPY01_0340, partial [Yersinia pestis PY-01]|jgi:predicted nucleic acid-binding protein